MDRVTTLFPNLLESYLKILISFASKWTLLICLNRYVRNYTNFSKSFYLLAFVIVFFHGVSLYLYKEMIFLTGKNVFILNETFRPYTMFMHYIIHVYCKCWYQQPNFFIYQLLRYIKAKCFRKEPCTRIKWAVLMLLYLIPALPWN